MKSAKKFLAVIAVFAAIGGFLFSGCASPQSNVAGYTTFSVSLGASALELKVQNDGVTPTVRDHGVVADDDGEVVARYIYKEGVDADVQEIFFPSKDTKEIAPGHIGFKVPPAHYFPELKRSLTLVANLIPDGGFAHSGGARVDESGKVKRKDGKEIWEVNNGGTGQWENEEGAGHHSCNLYFFQPDTPEWTLHLTHNWGEAADESASRTIKLADLQRWVDNGGTDPWPPAPEPEEESEGEDEEGAPPSGGDS